MTLLSRRQQLVQSFRDKEYRDAFVASRVFKGVAFKLRSIREARRWSQAELSQLSGHRQEVISRFEKTGYAAYSLKSLLRLASAFDVALLVDFVPFSELIDRVDSLSVNDMSVPSYVEDARLETPDILTYTLTSRVLTAGVTYGTAIGSYIGAPVMGSGELLTSTVAPVDRRNTVELSDEDALMSTLNTDRLDVGEAPYALAS